MGVEITDRNKENFIGKLDNEPYHLKSLKLGQILHFGTEHICDTEYEDDDAAKMDYYFNTLITISNDVLERNEFGQFDKIHDYDWETYLGE